MTKQSPSYVYILTNTVNTVLYVGVTSNLVSRVYTHKQKLVDGFTKRHNIDKLVYFEQYDDITAAITREKQLKGGSRKQKIDLILQENPDFRELYDDICE